MARGTSRSSGYDRSSRVGDLIKEEIASLLTYGEVKDPRIEKAGIITLTGVKMTKDLKTARVFFTITGLSSVGGDASSNNPKRKEDIKGAEAGLNNASGFIRKEVGKKVSLKYMPTLTFEYDESFDYATRIGEVMSAVRNEDGFNSRGDSAEEDADNDNDNDNGNENN